MTKLEGLLFVSLGIMVLVWFVCIARLARQLRERHPDTADAMEIDQMWPKDLAGWLRGFDNSGPVMGLFRFLFRREYVGLGDPAISDLAVFMRRLCVIYIGVFAWLFALVATDIIKAPRHGAAQAASSPRDEAFALHQAQKLPQAIDAYDALIAKAPDDAELLYWRGRAHWSLGHTDAALTDFRRTMRLQPGNLDVPRNADRIMSAQSRWDEVIAMWHEYIRANPSDPEGYFERGGAYFHKGDIASARSDAARSCELGKAEMCAWLERLKNR